VANIVYFSITKINEYIVKLHEDFKRVSSSLKAWQMMNY
jgi:hypothetical protein